MDGTQAGRLPETRVVARQARNIFCIAASICAILAFDVTYLGLNGTGAGAGLRSCFAPLLLWSLVAAAYGFHCLARTNARLMEQLRNRLLWDRMKGLRQLATIKARLRGQTAPESE
jgi:hypothetical protein